MTDDARDVLDEAEHLQQRISTLLGRAAVPLHVSWVGDGPHVAVHLDDLRELLDAVEMKP